MRWLRLVGSFEFWVSFAEYRLFHRALLPKESYNFKEPCNQSHPIHHVVSVVCIYQWIYINSVGVCIHRVVIYVESVLWINVYINMYIDWQCSVVYQCTYLDDQDVYTIHTPAESQTSCTITISRVVCIYQCIHIGSVLLYDECIQIKCSMYISMKYMDSALVHIDTHT